MVVILILLSGFAVSVPLRGKRLVERHYTEGNTPDDDPVSVPLRGKRLVEH